MDVLPTYSRAPWNQSEPESVTARKKVYLTVSKEMDLTTFDTEMDEDEGHEVFIARKDADWEKAYKADLLNLDCLLAILKKEATHNIDYYKRRLDDASGFVAKGLKNEIAKWEEVSKACDGWNIEVEDVE